MSQVWIIFSYNTPLPISYLEKHPHTTSYPSQCTHPSFQHLDHSLSAANIIKNRILKVTSKGEDDIPHLPHYRYTRVNLPLLAVTGV